MDDIYHPRRATYGRTEIVRWSQNDSNGNPAVYHHVCADPIQNAVSVSLSKFMTCDTWYDVVEGVNDAIDFTLPVEDPGVIYTAFLEPGKYTYEQYAKAVKDSINANPPNAPGSSDCKYERVSTFKFDIKYDRDVIWLFGTGPNQTRAIYHELGFPPQDIAVASGVWQEAYNASHLGCSITLIRSSKLAGGRRWGTQSNSRDQSILKDVIFTLPHTGNPASGSPGEHFLYEDLHDHMMSDNTVSFQGPRQIDEFDLLLMTSEQHNNLPHDINGGVPCMLVLTFQCLERFK